MLPASTERTPGHTDPAVNERLRQEITLSVLRHWGSGREAVERRLEALEREWDIGRAIEAGAAVLLLIGVLMGAFVSWVWLVAPATVAALLLQHALQGSRLLASLFRRLGFRTTHEIEYERCALKALRGDFKEAPSLAGPCDGAEAEKLLRAVMR